MNCLQLVLRDIRVAPGIHTYYSVFTNMQALLKHGLCSEEIPRENVISDDAADTTSTNLVVKL